jgi:hypothetical protein
VHGNVDTRVGPDNPPYALMVRSPFWQDERPLLQRYTIPLEEDHRSVPIYNTRIRVCVCVCVNYVV